MSISTASISPRTGCGAGRWATTARSSPPKTAGIHGLRRSAGPTETLWRFISWAAEGAAGRWATTARSSPPTTAETIGTVRNGDDKRDLRAIHMAADGKRGWVAGRRGTILHTDSGWTNWTVLNGGDDGPDLYAIHMHDEGMHGWAVGPKRHNPCDQQWVADKGHYSIRQDQSGLYRGVCRGLPRLRMDRERRRRWFWLLLKAGVFGPLGIPCPFAPTPSM